MSLIHADNFSIYGGSTAEMTATGRYSQVGGSAIVADPDGVSSGSVLRMQGSYPGTTIVRRALFTATNKVGIGQRVWLDSLPSNDSQRPELFYWHDASNTPMARVRLQTTGALFAEVFDTTSGAFGDWYPLGTTAGPAISAGIWWQMEAAFDASALTLEVRVEGAVKLEFTSVDFGGHLHNGPNIYQCGIQTQADGSGFYAQMYLKDYFWWDGLGTRNNDFMGQCLVAELDPDGDVTQGYWGPSAGTEAWSILDNDPADTPYMDGAYPVGAAMEVTLTNLPPTISSVKGIVSLARAKKTDGGTGQIQVSMISGASASAGLDRAITAAWGYWEDIHEIDPATSAAWIPAAVDASHMKIDRTA